MLDGVGLCLDKSHLDKSELEVEEATLGSRPSRSEKTRDSNRDRERREKGSSSHRSRPKKEKEGGGSKDELSRGSKSSKPVNGDGGKS